MGLQRVAVPATLGPNNRLPRGSQPKTRVYDEPELRPVGRSVAQCAVPQGGGRELAPAAHDGASVRARLCSG